VRGTACDGVNAPLRRTEIALLFLAESISSTTRSSVIVLLVAAVGKVTDANDDDVSRGGLEVEECPNLVSRLGNGAISVRC